jgi:protein-tyrosine phosphatase
MKFAMHEIVSKKLWIANAFEARDLRLLGEHEVEAVIDLAANESPAQLGHQMIYCRFPLIDGDDNEPSLLEIAIRTTASMIERGIKVVVACSAGMSRSPAITAAALSLNSNREPDECLLEISRNHPHDVSPALWQSVKETLNRIRS